MDKALYAKILNKAYGRCSTDADRMMAISMLYHMKKCRPRYTVPRETAEKGDDNMEQRKFKVGDKVKVNDRGSFEPCVGIGEIIYINNNLTSPYLVGIKGFKGHSGNGLGGEEIAEQKGYDTQCWWCEESVLELLEEKKMETVFELKMGKHVVEVRDGYRYLLVKQEGDTIVGLNLDDSTTYTTLVLDENLQDIENHSFDIKRVYEYRNCGFSKIKENLSDPVWERKHVKEMTIAEIEKELGYAIKVVKEKK